MKKADLKRCIDDGTIVAVYDGYRPQDVKVPSGAKRATVIALGVKRRVFTGARHDFGGHIADDGVVVRFEEDPKYMGNELITRARSFGRDEHDEAATARHERVVAPRDVLAPWDEYAKQHAEKQSQNDRVAARLENEKLRCERAVAKLGVGFVHWNYDKRTHKIIGYQVVLSADDAGKLAGLEES